MNQDLLVCERFTLRFALKLQALEESKRTVVFKAAFHKWELAQLASNTVVRPDVPSTLNMAKLLRPLAAEKKLLKVILEYNSKGVAARPFPPSLAVMLQGNAEKIIKDTHSRQFFSPVSNQFNMDPKFVNTNSLAPI